MSIFDNLTDKDKADFMTRFPTAFYFLADRSTRNKLTALQDELQAEQDPARKQELMDEIGKISWRVMVGTDQDPEPAAEQEKP